MRNRNRGPGRGGIPEGKSATFKWRDKPLFKGKEIGTEQVSDKIKS